MSELLSHEKCVYLLKRNFIGYLSYIHQTRPYIAPITYFFDESQNVIIGYSSEGQKIRDMRTNRGVSLCVTEISSVNSWKSILAHGVFSELTGSDARAQLHLFSLGVKKLVSEREHRNLDFLSEFSSKTDGDMLPIVFHIKVEEITGRIRLTE